MEKVYYCTFPLMLPFTNYIHASWIVWKQFETNKGAWEKTRTQGGLEKEKEKRLLTSESSTIHLTDVAMMLAQ